MTKNIESNQGLEQFPAPIQSSSNKKEKEPYEPVWHLKPRDSVALTNNEEADGQRTERLLTNLSNKRQEKFLVIEDAGIEDFPEEQLSDVMQRIVWDGYSDEVGLIYKALRAPNITLANKNRLLTEIFKSEGSVGVGEMGSESQDHLLDLLVIFTKNESNFFLKNLAETFLSETYPEYSVQDQLKWIIESWKHAYTFDRRAQVSFWGEVSFSDREINSPSDLTNAEIEKIIEIIHTTELSLEPITVQNND